MVCNRLFGDIVRRKCSCLYLLGNFLRCVLDLISAAVVDGENQVHLFKVPGIVFQFFHALLQAILESAPVADKHHAHTAFQVLICLTEVIPEQIHDGVHFVLRPFPVLRGENIKRGISQTNVPAVQRQVFEILRTFTVSEFSWHTTLGCPSAVAVHNKAYVLRQLFRHCNSAGGWFVLGGSFFVEKWQSHTVHLLFCFQDWMGPCIVRCS